MEPVSPVILIAQLLLKYGPTLALQIITLLKKEQITTADWDDLEALIKKPFDSYFPPKG